MFATFFFELLLLSIVLDGVQMYIDAHVGIDLTTPAYPSAPKGELDPDR